MIQSDLKELDRQQHDNAWNLYDRNPVVGACFQVIRNTVFGGGVQVKANTALTERQSTTLALRAFDWMMCTGVVPVTFERGPENVLFPVIPARESVQLFVRTTESGSVEFLGKHRMDDNIMAGLGSRSASSIMVWPHTDRPPTATGAIVTPLTKLESSERLVAHLRSCVMVSEEIRSNPYYITQTRNTGNTDNQGTVWGHTPADTELEHTSRLAALEATLRYQHELHAENWGSASSLQGHLAQRCMPRPYPLPVECDSVRPIIPPSCSADLLAHIKAADETVCQTLGVPYGMISTTVGGQYGVGMNEFVINTTVQRIKLQLENFLNDCLRICMLCAQNEGEADDPGAGTKRKRQRHDGGSVTKDDGGEPADGAADIEVVVPNYDFSQTGSDEKRTNMIVVPGIPCMRHEAVYKMMDTGVLTFVEGARTLRGAIGARAATDAELQTQRAGAEKEASSRQPAEARLAESMPAQGQRAHEENPRTAHAAQGLN